MPFSISGYVLEPIRVGQANSTFTQTPDNYISDQAAFDAAYPADESEPRTDYMVFVTSEGASPEGLLATAEFGWTKNEIIRRFDYAGQAGAFKPLRGSSDGLDVGTLTLDSNTNRLSIRVPAQVTPAPEAPWRLSVGPATESGTAFNLNFVVNDAAFTSPLAGQVQVSLETGNLNWHPTDLSLYQGQLVRFQRQQFFEFSDSTGLLGQASDLLLLNPKPGTGQHPLLKFGFGLYLTTVEVTDELSFTVPPAGTVEWALDTGRLNFNPTDVADNAGIPVYYDGVLFDTGMSLPRENLGDIAAPSAVSLPINLGMDLIFTLPAAPEYYQFPQVTYLDNSLFSAGQLGVVQVDPDTGDVKFSDSDEATYAGEDVTVVSGDLEIERGISIRLLRTPVNLDGSQGFKDVSAIYMVEGAVWADPIIGAPQVFLPSTPIQSDTYPLTLKVLQGQGAFTSDDFPRLDVPSPPEGLGYYIDFDEGVLYYARRKEQELVPILQASPTLLLPDPLVLASNLEVGLETGPGTGVYDPLTIGTDVLFDPTSGAVSFVEQSAPTASTGSTGTTLGTTLTDPSADFVSDGVLPGYIVLVTAPDTAEGVYTVSSVTSASELEVAEAFLGDVSGVSYTVHSSKEVLADRFFSEVTLVDPSTKVERLKSLGVATNAPRLSVPIAYVGSTGIRFGDSSNGVFPTMVVVADDGSFTAPVEGTVEISQETGNLNFAFADLGKSVSWSRELQPKTDYLLSAELGLIQFNDRMLTNEEVLITYTTAPPSTDPPTEPGAPIQEYGRFLIRKELTQPHPAPTSTLEFNPDGFPVTNTPPPAVFRGGRPQQLGVQCVVDTSSSTITFLADSQLTDALPHGPTVGPEERVYIDYYVTQAIGGEQTVTVLVPPMLTATVNISELDGNGDPNNQFVIEGGDYTSSFPANHLMRIENEEAYLIGSSSYDFSTNQTTVVLAGTQVFQTDFNDPVVYVSSGPTPTTSAPLSPSYFAAELAAYEDIPRGSQTFKVAGDRSTSYRTGTVLMFTDGGSTFIDFVQTTGAGYDAVTDRTEVSLSSKTVRQYNNGVELLSYSVRPVFEPPTTVTQTSKTPVLTEPYTVYRKVLGQSGVILSEPIDYSINDSGAVVFVTELLPAEEFGILYTGLEVQTQIGVNLRASYTFQIAPNGQNGLEGQILTADYSLFSPDTFYYRVETMTNFRGEYALEIASAASSGSAGPQTENSSQPQLFEQGRTSLYFDEKHLANQDIIARSSLLFYNDSINLLEDYLESLDGRVVGNNDGRLLFDGTTGDVHPPGAVTNQIDDTIQVSPAPYEITFPPFAVTSVGTFRKYYLPGSRSRFYPTQRDFFSVSAVEAGTTQPGDEVVDTKSTDITAVTRLHTRQAWAVVTESTEFSGPTTLKVDFASGSEPGFVDEQANKYARPPFTGGMECVVQRRDGSFINDSGSPVTVGGVADNELTISGLAGTADAGTTIYQSPLDANITHYLFSRDFGFNGDNGQITYVQEIAALSNTPIPEEEPLSGSVNRSNSLTAPDKFPALYGGIEDDDGDLSFPIQTPSPVSEKDGFLATEDKLIHDPGGLLRDNTTAPFVGTGDLNDTGGGVGDTITNSAGNFTAPLPKVHDLVRFLDGVNGPSDFVRITAVGADTITIDTDFTTDTGFTYEIAVTDGSVTGLSELTSTTTQLDDTGANFLSTAAPGLTVVFTSGGQNGERRQIEEVLSNTSLVLTPALPGVPGLGAYRIDNSLATYGGTSNDYLADLETALTGQTTLYPNQETYILDFLDQVFTDVATGATGQTTAGQPTLDDAGATFLSDEVTAAHFVYIVSGANAGFYPISAVNSETQLEITGTFPATLAGVSYRVVSLFGVSSDSVTDLFSLYQSIETLPTSAAAFLALVSTPVGVVRAGVADTDSFARGTLLSDLDSRDAEVDARLAAIPTTIETVETILSSTDTLYDKRYVWIDARINLESGLVVQQETAVGNRIKTQEDNLNQLIKLIAVEGS